MFELPLLIFIIAGVLFLIIIGAIWRYSSRESNADVGRYSNYPDSRRRVYQPNDSREATRRQSPTTYSRPTQANFGHAYQDSEIEAIKTRLSNMERAIGFIQEDLGNIFAERESANLSSQRLSHHHQNALSSTQSSLDKSPNAYAEGRDVFSTACEAYRKLSAEGLRDLPIEPLFVVLDMDSSIRGSAIGEAKRNFKQSDNKQSAFVVFKGGVMTGWIFPNPRISFTEAMKYVFPNLSYENFEEAKNSVEPRKVRVISDGAWETVAS